MRNIENFLKSIEECIINHRSTIVWIGIAIVLLMILFPPWIFEVSKGGAVYRIDGKYGLLFNPPGIEYHLDLPRLFLQCLPFVIIIVPIIFLKISVICAQEIKHGESSVNKYEGSAGVVDTKKMNPLPQEEVQEKNEAGLKQCPNCGSFSGNFYKIYTEDGSWEERCFHCKKSRGKYSSQRIEKANREVKKYKDKIEPNNMVKCLILGTVWLAMAGLSAFFIRSCLGSINK